eukprot:373485-Pelagomonas_calceolata.AAC.1
MQQQLSWTICKGTRVAGASSTCCVCKSAGRVEGRLVSRCAAGRARPQHAQRAQAVGFLMEGMGPDDERALGGAAAAAAAAAVAAAVAAAGMLDPKRRACFGAGDAAAAAAAGMVLGVHYVARLLQGKEHYVVHLARCIMLYIACCIMGACCRATDEAGGQEKLSAGNAQWSGFVQYVRLLQGN